MTESDLRPYLDLRESVVDGTLQAAEFERRYLALSRRGRAVWGDRRAPAPAPGGRTGAVQEVAARARQLVLAVALVRREVRAERGDGVAPAVGGGQPHGCLFVPSVAPGDDRFCILQRVAVDHPQGGRPSASYRRMSRTRSQRRHLGERHRGAA